MNLAGRHFCISILLILAFAYAPFCLAEKSPKPVEKKSLQWQAAETSCAAEIQHAAAFSFASFPVTYRALTEHHQWGCGCSYQLENLFCNITQLIGSHLSELIDGPIAACLAFLVSRLEGAAQNTPMALIYAGGSSFSSIFYLFYFMVSCFFLTLARQKSLITNWQIPQALLLQATFLAAVSWIAYSGVWLNGNSQLPSMTFSLEVPLVHTVKAGLISSGDFATELFAPLLKNLSILQAGLLVGSIFYFAAAATFCLLLSILAMDLLYLLCLFSLRAAILFMQACAAPYFLLAYLVPGKQRLCIDFLTVFVEISIWGFVWISLLKDIEQAMLSDLNPWLKIIITICFLKLMIQVPRMLAHSGLSPILSWIQLAKCEIVRSFALAD